MNQLLENQVDFYNFTQSELSSYFEAVGEKKFRAQQLYRWVHSRRVVDHEKMTDVSKELRTKLPSMFRFELPPLLSEHVSVDGTRKYLSDVGDGMSVETVLIPSPGRLTLCVSTEVGCNMACQFCYTGKQKLRKRLSAGQIVGQFLNASDRLKEDERISNIVFMGMGEPLDNEEAVFRSIEIFHDSWGLNLSRKRITVSTSGLVDKIPLVTKARVRLAVSLNAVDDETRNKIMPINRKWPIQKLLDACEEHARQSGDKVTLEYVLLKGVTDSIADARKLYEITRRVPNKINIIPFNEHPGSGFYRPDEDTIRAFHAELMRLGAHVLRRKTMGRDIFAACGQLTNVRKNHPQGE